MGHIITLAIAGLIGPIGVAVSEFRHFMGWGIHG